MSKDTGINRFAFAGNSINIQRSRFDRSWTHTTTFKSGDLVPIFCDAVLPGDTVKLDYSMVTRMLTPVAPTFGNLFFDIFFFFVPYRLIAGTVDDPKVWQKLQGENTSGYWAPSSETVLDTANFIHCHPGSVANYLGLPCFNPQDVKAVNPEYMEINLLPFKAYTLVWNEFFRDQNSIAPLDVDTYGIAGSGAYEIDGRIEEATDGYVNYGNPEATLKVAKLHDYFTSALPAPQKGASVSLPLGTYAPVDATPNRHNVSRNAPLTFKNAQSGTNVTSSGDIGLNNGSLAISSTGSGYSYGYLTPDNLYADLSQATAATINNLRQAFAIQKVLEKDARGGSRYREMIKSHFSTTLPDFTAQVPEYLGGKRVPINVTQVLQTSNNTQSAASLVGNHIGTVGAFSNTADSDHVVSKSFNEFGLILGVCCVRNIQQYSQGINREWFKKRRFDFYLPAFANLGEQAIGNAELYFDPSGTGDNEGVFGYQEAWAEYRYHPNLISGNLAPGAQDATMTAWTYANNFSAMPTLGKDFIEQSETNVGNTLYDTTTDTQFVMDTYFKCDFVRPMPVNSIPGGLGGRW